MGRTATVDDQAARVRDSMSWNGQERSFELATESGRKTPQLLNLARRSASRVVIPGGIRSGPVTLSDPPKAARSVRATAPRPKADLAPRCARTACVLQAVQTTFAQRCREILLCTVRSESSAHPSYSSNLSFQSAGTRLATLGAAVPVLHSEVDMKSILDRSFRYTKSVDTDLRKTFARVRREQRLSVQQEHDGGSTKVVQMKQRGRTAAA